MKTALITGVSGYLGSHLAKTLNLAGWKVVGLDKRHTDNRYIHLFYPCDVNDNESLNILFDRVNIDVVFHLAGRIEISESVKHPCSFFHNNTAGTNSVLNAIERSMERMFASNALIELEEVAKVLSLGIPQDVPQILVLNQIDRIGMEAGLERDEYGRICKVRISAKNGDGLEFLQQALKEHQQKLYEYLTTEAAYL